MSDKKMDALRKYEWKAWWAQMLENQQSEEQRQKWLDMETQLRVSWDNAWWKAASYDADADA